MSDESLVRGSADQFFKLNSTVLNILKLNLQFNFKISVDYKLNKQYNIEGVYTGFPSALQ